MVGCRQMLISPSRVSCMPRRVCAHAGKDKAKQDRDSPPAGANSAEVAMLLTIASLSAAPAYADVDDAVTTAVDSVKAAGEALKAGKAAAESAFGAANEVYQKVSPTVGEYVEKATPYVKGAYTEASKVVVPFANDLVSKGVPIVTEGTSNLLKSSGVDVDSISREAQVASKTVTDVSTKATPFLTKVTNFLSSSSPETLGKIGLLLVAVYYLTPFALKTAVSSLRGYAGEITPARAVDLVATDPSVAIIDIRPLKEKSAVGTPDVPSSARGRFLELEVAEIDRRLRGQLRNVDAVEAQVTALEIQALKRVKKDTKILLLDKNGNGASKDVAKELASLGFANAFVIAGGFQGWVASKLQTKAPVGNQLNGAGGLGDLVGSAFASGTRRLR